MKVCSIRGENSSSGINLLKSKCYNKVQGYSLKSTKKEGS